MLTSWLSQHLFFLSFRSGLDQAYLVSVLEVTCTPTSVRHMQLCKILVLQNCLVSEKSGFLYLNEIFTLTYSGKFIWKFLTFWLNYYYESLILGGKQIKSCQKHPSILVLQNCLVSEKNGFVYLNEIFKLTYPGKFIWKFLFFGWVTITRA